MNTRYPYTVLAISVMIAGCAFSTRFPARPPKVGQQPKPTRMRRNAQHTQINKRSIRAIIIRGAWSHVVRDQGT